MAVASNFAAPMNKIVEQFEALSGHTVVVSSSSSGKLYAQIRHGAPFHAFLSADDDKPQALVDAGLAVEDSHFTYALGRLALWSADAGLVDGPAVLEQEGLGRVAIPNPRLAPYGAAAVEVLTTLGVWQRLSRQLVQGENIAQTFNFVHSGNAAVGLVAAAQLVGQGGSYWLVPRDLHQPIRQDAVLLHRGRNLAAARELVDYLRSDAARNIIADFGYDLPLP